MIAPNINQEWQPGQGWLGVVPGVTLIRDAINKLGGTCETSEMANGYSFDFEDGLIRVTSIEQQGTISKLWISGELAGHGTIPGSLSSAREVFPELRHVGSDATNAEIYACSSVRLAATPGPDGKVIWIEFFPV